jgi:phosphoglycolate phosphatase
MPYDKMQLMMNKVILLFDIDGTLLLSGGAGKECFDRAAYELFQIEKCWQEGYLPDGKTDPFIIEELIESRLERKLSKDEFQAVSKRYLDYFEKSIHASENFRVMPGISDLIPFLAAKENLHLGITTGNFKIAAEFKLKKANLHSHFQFGGFACDSHLRDELTLRGFERAIDHIGTEISKENVFVIGDTIYDIRSGKSIGAKTVAVATGSTPYETLKAEKPDFCFHDFSRWQDFLVDLQIETKQN